MADPLLYPKLRWPLDLRFEKVNNQEILLLRCPLGIVKEPLLLVSAVAPIISCFQGEMSLDEITEKFQPHGVKKELIQELVKILDSGLFLSSPRFFEAEKTMRDDYAQNMLRAAALAGQVYSASPDKLGKEIDQWLAHGTHVSGGTNGKMVGLVAPHIDYRRGGISYGITYSQLRNHEHDLYIVIGTSHQYSSRLFHLTRKDFANPFGALACDRPFVENLARLHGADRSFADEILHRNEHSLELQLPFLKRVRQTPTIVPILVGSFHHMLNSGKEPSAFDEYESFAASLAETVRAAMNEKRRVCFVAGVDMAHIGRSFGDSGSLSAEHMEKIRKRDKIYLDAIVRQDKKTLFSHIAEDGDARRICGFPTMYTVIDVADRLNLRYRGEVFDYRQAVDYKTDCAVTFAGVGLFT